MLSSVAVRAQQPFNTDDADVTDKGKFHFEFSNQYDVLQRSLHPTLRQNTANLELDYGLFKGVEIGVDGPLLAISQSRAVSAKTLVGVGDINLHLKYNFYREREHSRLPAMTLNFNVELPTGDKTRQLGSGLADYYHQAQTQRRYSLFRQ